MKGSTSRDFDFTSTGMMGFSSTMFNPGGSVNRLDVSVALVNALGHDSPGRQPLSTVTWQGVPLTDNPQIPSGLRRYVQIALDKGVFEAFPAEVRQMGPSQYQVLPGPRFEPATTLKRSTLAAKLGIFRQRYSTGG